MADDDKSLTAATVAVKAVTENADRLGLTWQLRPGTVEQVDAITGITVTVDGDATPITATSMIGSVKFGQRVYVLLIPPGGVFIAGVVGTSGGVYTQYFEVVTATSAINFQGIPPNLREMEITWSGRTTASGTLQNLRMRINGSASSLYSTEFTQASAGATSSALIDSGANAAFVGQLAASGSGGNVSGSGKIWFPDPSTTVFAPTWSFLNGIIAPSITNRGAGVYATTGLINFVQLFPEVGIWAVGSNASLKGIFV